MTDDFDTWLTALERQVERIPTLHGDHAGVKTELRRLVAYARGRTVAYARARRAATARDRPGDRSRARPGARPGARARTAA